MDIVAVTDSLPTAGAIVWWRLSGTVNVSTLIDVWDEAGLDLGLLPSNPSRATALRRAATAQAGKNRLVRGLSGGGFAVVLEKLRAGRDVDYEFAARVYLNESDALVVEGPYASLTAGERAFVSKLRSDVSDAFRAALVNLSTEDVSGWLAGLMTTSLDAVALRDHGGVYFIPAHRVELYGHFAQAIRKASAHELYKIPALRSDDAVRAILDSVEAEAQREVSAIWSELEGGLGERAIATRVSQCSAIEAKVSRYESLLGAHLNDLRERLEGLRAGLTVAAVKSGAADNLREG